VCDGNVVHLGHHARADGRWRVYAFAPAGDATALHTWADAVASTIARFTPDGADVDAVFDVKAIYRHPFEEIDITRVPELFLPRTGPLALTDWEKVYAAGPSAWTDADIFAERGLSDDGVVVVVRPDQYVAGVFPLAATEELAGFFETALLPQSAPAPLR
ncbi:MAG: 3-hydroxybenzoate 4-monooxygenase, partial [Microbacterium chocolatum]|nr:3-hydroxybenzoate 4-monooxygenase [Microbacterium chocolatum]